MLRRWMQAALFLWICWISLFSLNQPAAAEADTWITDRIVAARNGNATFYNTNAFGMPGVAPRMLTTLDANVNSPGAQQIRINALNDNSINNSASRTSNFAGFLGLLGLAGFMGRLRHLSEESRP